MRDLLDEWVRISWSLNEDFDSYLKRSKTERILLHDRLSVQIEKVYGDGEGPPQQSDVKQGF